MGNRFHQITQNMQPMQQLQPLQQKEAVDPSIVDHSCSSALLARIVVAYLIHIQKARKHQRALQAARKKQYEERRRQLQETFDNDLDE